MQNRYGDFRNLSEEYKKARKGVPISIIKYIIEMTCKNMPHILDVACGTGIATRQLYKASAKVIGTDIAPEMIKQAELDNYFQIKYSIAPAESQPFAPKSFDAITVFSAFHWFAKPEVVEEFKRLLKSGGMVFIINKDDVGDFKSEFRRILADLGVREIPNIKSEYNPERLLSENGFTSVCKKTFKAKESFSEEQIINYFKSTSLWNLLKADRAGKVSMKLHKYFLDKNKHNKIERQIEVSVISTVLI